MSNSILIADDSVAIRKVLQKAFQKDARYNLVLLTSVQDILKNIRVHNETDLLIVSASLPGVLDEGVIAKFKEYCPNLSIMMIHGSFDKFNRSELAKYGVAGFLKKPFKLEDLKRSLSEIGFEVRDGDRMMEMGAGDETKEDFEMPLPNQVAEPFGGPKPVEGAVPVPKVIAQSITTPPANATQFPKNAAFPTEEQQDTMSYHAAHEAMEKILANQQDLPSRNRATITPSRSEYAEELVIAQQERVIRESVLEYCNRNFKDIAREILKQELHKLMHEKSRLQSDSHC